MPSRKRAKGQARKRATALADQTRREWQTVPFSNGCRHAAAPISQGHISGKFLETFWRSSNPSAVASFGLANEYYPDVLNNDAYRALLMKYFVAQGEESILVGLDANLAVACCSANAVLILESDDPSKDIAGIFTRIIAGKPKNLDIVQGCERSLVRFFSKRSSCACLDEKCAAVKSMPKTAICVECRQRKIRSSLYVCAGCNTYQYCSRKCQAKHWPLHKTWCPSGAFWMKGR